MLKKLAIVLTMTMAAPAFAATQTWSGFGGWPGSTASSLSLSSGGIGLTVQGWSDTGGTNDNIVRDALLKDNGSSYGLGILNDDEVSSNSTSSPHHSIDSFTDDAEMVSLTFTKAVNLTDVLLGWARDGNSGNSAADMSFGAFNGSADALNGKTWQDIKNTLSWSSSESDVTTGSYQAISTGGVFANVWLVGAYNPIFQSLSGHGANNDGLKLKGLRTLTKDGGDIPAPSSLLLLIIGLLSMRALRKPSRSLAA